MKHVTPSGCIVTPAPIDWLAVLSGMATLDRSVPEVTFATPGYSAGMAHLSTFITTRIRSYEASRNDPTCNAQSGLSLWLRP